MLADAIPRRSFLALGHGAADAHVKSGKIDRMHRKLGIAIPTFDGVLLMLSTYGLYAWWHDALRMRSLTQKVPEMINHDFVTPAGMALLALFVLSGLAMVWGISLIRNQTWCTGPIGYCFSIIHLAAFPIGTVLGVWFFISVLSQRKDDLTSC